MQRRICVFVNMHFYAETCSHLPWLPSMGTKPLKRFATTAKFTPKRLAASNEVNADARQYPVFEKIDRM